MIDLTSKLDDVRSLGHDWTREQVRRALSALAALCPGGTVDWEEGDEEWGRVISRGEVAAYVSARRPLAFILSHDEAEVRQVSSRLGLVAIAADDFDAPSFRVAPSALAHLTQRALTEHVCYDKASVNDLWYATV